MIKNFVKILFFPLGNIVITPFSTKYLLHIQEQKYQNLFSPAHCFLLYFLNLILHNLT